MTLLGSSGHVLSVVVVVVTVLSCPQCCMVLNPFPITLLPMPWAGVYSVPKAWPISMAWNQRLSFTGTSSHPSMLLLTLHSLSPGPGSQSALLPHTFDLAHVVVLSEPLVKCVFSFRYQNNTATACSDRPVIGMADKISIVSIIFNNRIGRFVNDDQ